jgi:NTE family protein
LNPKIGIVLSGGGARGVAHLGILKALEEFGIKPSILSGTSAGAIAGAFYAKGYSIAEILKIVKEGHFFGFSNMAMERKGLFSMKGFAKIYSEYFPQNSFEELNLPLYIAATDILNGEITYFSTGDLSRSIMASSCVPLVFKPISINGTQYIDGGVLNNFPIEPLIGQCDKIIGIDVNSIKKEEKEISIKNILDRSFHLALSTSMRSKIEKCDLFIQPPNMSQFGMFDMKKIQKIYDYGYTYGIGLEKEIKRIMLEI